MNVHNSAESTRLSRHVRVAGCAPRPFVIGSVFVEPGTGSRRSVVAGATPDRRCSAFWQGDPPEDTTNNACSPNGVAYPRRVQAETAPCPDRMEPCPRAPETGLYAADATGVTFNLEAGLLRLEVCNESIIRVQYAAGPSLPDKTSLSVNNEWGTPSFCVTESSGTVTITTSRLKASVDTTSGLVTYADLNDDVILSEDSKSLTPVTVEGVSTNRVETVFNSPADEALFGLGQHQDGVMNRKGTTRRILNANTEINVPMLVSNRGYGVFWDNYSASDFDGTESNDTKYSYASEAGEIVDYYFFYGPSIDQVVAQYRAATGAAPLFPKWAYGLFQSKDKYGSQAELLRVKDGYRDNNIPVDCIVQDWDYWTPHAWGSHFMDQGRYPDPAALIDEMHNTEPQGYPDRVDVRSADTALGKGALYVNAYPLGHAQGLYEHWRTTGPKEKRVYVLSRSAFAGQQRYATTCWSGDINSDFPTYTRQIPAGLNFSLAGMPYWTTDIGGYWGHNVDWTTSANNELFTRWFQYGAFSPIFRIHGGGSRELYSNSWSAATKANLLKIDNLRYRLMPYIYSLAWKVTSEGYTMMRHLVFDYPVDEKVLDIKDQFLFGPALLVNPVTAAGATSRSVYLPAGTWYDFWTGSTTDGGRTASVPAPLGEIPLFVKAGSIVPMGPGIQYATQSIDPVEILIYAGQDGSFTMYEDEGDSYSYEDGQHSTIPLTWDESAKKLTIGARTGSYRGMPASRTFRIVWVGSNHGAGVDVTAAADRVVAYDGSEVVVTAN
ncbi:MULTISPECIES: glycoside hydrolase family 31 protein [Sorangium]|uniref:glycoside hydrolase family 31 protein n=1 Tax=Sorangium TaxID=39643 RepID=UPI003D9C61B0